jgi:hypothetical protein
MAGAKIGAWCDGIGFFFGNRGKTSPLIYTVGAWRI